MRRERVPDRRRAAAAAAVAGPGGPVDRRMHGRRGGSGRARDPIPRGRRLWGRYDPEAHSVSREEGPGPGIHDLFDLAAIHTLTQRGTVHAVKPDEVPGPGPLAAIYRY